MGDSVTSRKGRGMEGRPLCGLKSCHDHPVTEPCNAQTQCTLVVKARRRNPVPVVRAASIAPPSGPTPGTFRSFIPLLSATPRMRSRRRAAIPSLSLCEGKKCDVSLLRKWALPAQVRVLLLQSKGLIPGREVT